MKRTLYGIMVGFAMFASSTASAQTYPNRPVHLIIPTAPGGLLDGFARMIGDGITASWGQPAVVEHKPGAGGIIGAEFVSKAAPDGYTLLMGNIGPLAISPALHKKLPYDAIRDFAAVSLVATFPNVLVVGTGVPVRNLAELIALAKQKPGSLYFASSGTGQTAHLSGEVFKRLAGIDIVHVPYKGTGPSLTDVVGGQVQMTFSNVPPALPLIKGGRLRALAVTSLQRSPVLPDIPTMNEAGATGYEVVSWCGVVAPRATPAEIISRLNALIARTTNTPDAVEKYNAQGAVPGTKASAAEFSAFMKAEFTKWATIVRQADIKPE